MQTISVSFEMSDALMARAIRQNLAAFGRKQLKPWELALVACSGAIFFLAIARDSHWLWWLAGLPLAFYAFALLVWLLLWWWQPRVAARRTAHFPHRRVTLELTEPALAFESANQRLEVKWSELEELRRLPDFWLVCLRTGSKVPVPLSSLSDDAVALLRSHVPAQP